MSEQQFLWNSLDGGENVFIKERGSDKSIHIKIIEGKYEFVDFMKKVNEQQDTIAEQKEKVARVLNEYSRQFRRHSKEFSFMLDLAEDLGVQSLEAKDD